MTREIVASIRTTLLFALVLAPALATAQMAPPAPAAPPAPVAPPAAPPAAKAATTATAEQAQSTSAAAATQAQGAATTANDKAGSAVAKGKAAAVKLVDLNNSTIDEIKAVPGLAGVADKIVAARPFANKAQLVSKKILDKASYANVKNLVVAHKPRAATP